jgi:hypothetical protein
MCKITLLYNVICIQIIKKKAICPTYFLLFHKNPMSMVSRTMFDLCKYHTSIRRRTLLAITYSAVFGQVYCIRKKKKEKKTKRNILFYKTKSKQELKNNKRS